MSLNKSPFYILKLPCNVGRREIISASEEMSLLFDPEACSNAQNELINTNKRLSAEMDWFCNVDEETLEDIRDCIDENEPIATEDLSSIDCLNATIYNFSISEDDDIYELGYLILDIDEQFSQLDEYEIAECINSNHDNAGLAKISSNDVLTELNRKRGKIKQEISERLSSIEQTDYIELVTMIAEKRIDCDEDNGGDVLDDLIDQYEVRMHTEIEESTDHILNQITQIKQLVYDDAIESNVNSLIRRIKNWDKLVQPLQLKSQISGMPHEISENIGHEVRELAVYLHNDRGATDEALMLTEAMQDVFAELGELSDLLESDSDALENILQGQNDAEEVVAELDSLKNLASSIKTAPSSMNIGNFITRIKALDSKLKSLPLDTKTKNDIRSNLCFMAREAAVEIHNTKKQTSLALQITQALYDTFFDIPLLRTRLAEDKQVLSQELSAANRIYAGGTSSSKSSNPGCLIFIVIAIIIAIIIGVSDSGSSPSSSSSYSGGGSSYSTSAEVKFSSSVSAGDSVYIDITSIFPEIGIYTQGSSNYSNFVCRCKTSSGSTVWVYMTTSEYKNNFDSSVSTSIYEEYADTKTFTASKRIHGTAKKADSIMSGLSSDTGATMLIDFSSVK